MDKVLLPTGPCVRFGVEGTEDASGVVFRFVRIELIIDLISIYSGRGIHKHKATKMLSISKGNCPMARIQTRQALVVERFLSSIQTDLPIATIQGIQTEDMT